MLKWREILIKGILKKFRPEEPLEKFLIWTWGIWIWIAVVAVETSFPSFVARNQNIYGDKTHHCWSIFSIYQIIRIFKDIKRYLRIFMVTKHNTVDLFSLFTKYLKMFRNIWKYFSWQNTPLLIYFLYLPNNKNI